MNKRIKALIAVAIVVLAGIIAVVVGKSFTGTSVAATKSYDNVFYPGTTVNGIDVSELTAEEAKEKLSGLAADYSLDFLLKDSKLTLSAADMKMAVNDGADLQALQAGQTQVPLSETAPEALALEVDDLFAVDQEAIRQILSADKAFDMKAKDAQPTPSRLSYDADASKFILIDGKNGTAADLDKSVEAVRAAAERLEPQVDAAAQDLYVRPALTSDSPKAGEVLKKANSYLDLGISYTFADGETEKISKTFVSEIVYLDEKGEIQIDKDRVQSLVNKYVEDHNGATRNMLFTTTGGSEIELDVPMEGETIDATGLYEDILKCFADGKGGEREVPYKESEEVSSNFGGDYIEVDLNNQVLYFYQGGELEMTSDIVSGSVYLTHMTPTGVFQIYSMETNVTLKGPGYESPVTFWMPFNGSIGMHDASWRWQFGGDDYLYDGSHGCINMPYDNAAYVYNNAYIGYYVIVYGGVQYVEGQHIEVVNEDEDKPETKATEKKTETKETEKKTETTETKKPETKAPETQKPAETKAPETQKPTEAPVTEAPTTEPYVEPVTEPVTQAPDPEPEPEPDPGEGGGDEGGDGDIVDGE